MEFRRKLLINMTGADVKFIQLNLKESGFLTDRITGSFDKSTLDSVNKFQKEIGIEINGIVDSKTWMRIILYNNKLKESEKERIQKEEQELNLIEKTRFNIEQERRKQYLDRISDNNRIIEDRKRMILEQKRLISEEISNKILEEKKLIQQLEEEERFKKESIDKIFRIPSYIGEDNFRIYDYTLTDNFYIKEETKKEIIYLCNTNSGPRPDLVIKGFNIKKSSHFVIGGNSSDFDCDGKILKSIDDRYWSYCIDDRDVELNSTCISIQICNPGPLIIGENGEYYNLSHKLISKSDIIKIDNELQESFEKYTDEQIESLRKLIIYLKTRWNIQLEVGLSNSLFPQPEMIQMLNSL